MAQPIDLVEYELEMAALIGLDPDKVAHGTIGTKEPQSVEWSQIGVADDRPVTISATTGGSLIHHVMEVDGDTYRAVREVEDRRRALFPTAPPVP
jgi:hypothetical protein